MNQQTIVPHGNGEALASLTRLESRIQGAMDQLRSARRRESEAGEEAGRLRELLAKKEKEVERLHADVKHYHAEREQVRQRVESLLEQIEQLTE